MKKLLSLALVLIMLGTAVSTAFAQEDTKIDYYTPVLSEQLENDSTIGLAEDEEKYICNSTLEEDFTDDCVLLVLSRALSNKLYTYSEKSFPVDGIAGVRDLTSYTVEKYRKEREKHQDNRDYKFHQILRIDIKEKGKENVLKMIKLFEPLHYIISAEPNAIRYLGDAPKPTVPLLEKPAYGDANHDRKIDLHDVVHIQRFIAKLNDTMFCRKCADVYDRDVDMTDVVYIQKYIANIKTDSRCGENAVLGASLEPLPMNEETEKKITDAFIKYRTDVSEERLERLIEQHGKPAYANHYATLSDGTMIVISHFYDEDFTQAVGTFEINGYTYQYSSGGSIHHVLCTNGEYKSLQDAVNEGLLLDNIFEELAYHLHMEKIKP